VLRGVSRLLREAWRWGILMVGVILEEPVTSMELENCPDISSC
jgi:hypothetical protein